MRVRMLLLAALCLAWAAVAPSQVLPEPQLYDRLINYPSHLVLPPSTLEVLFTHRFTQSISAAGAGNLWGLDSAADIGLGLGVGFGDNLDAQIYRSSFQKQYELSGKWTALRQGSAMPLGLAVRVGTDYRAASGMTDRWSYFGQVVLAHRPASWVDLFLIPTYVTDTPTLTNAFNVGIAASFHLPGVWDIVAEATPANRDVPGSSVAWSLGLNIRITGHDFLIYLGNSRATVTDMIAGSDIPGGFNASDVRLGFNLIRRFPE
jgi:hypothetical protein